MYLNLFDSPSEIKCESTFDEIFKQDLRTIQNAEESHYPLKLLLHQEERDIKRNFEISADHFKFILYEEGEESAWDKPLIDYLKEIFKVDKVYSPNEKIIEHNHPTFLSKSGTLFHINIFNIDKELIIRDENYYNRTIMFWLFDDFLVFQYEDGKDTW
jgi:hypothetical protein